MTSFPSRACDRLLLLAACLLLPLFCACTQQTSFPTAPSYADCRSCHRAEAGSAPAVPALLPPGHNLLGGHDDDDGDTLPCLRCHLPPELQNPPLSSHESILSHPGALANAPAQCGQCHQKEIAGLERSLHATLAGIVNQTRYLFGAQPSASSPLHGATTAGGALELLPQPNPKALLDPSPAALVDDLLRRRCLRCHIDAAPPPEAPNSAALQRGLGCAACHQPHSQGPIPDQRCLACHNNNHTGADAHGLFMRDTDDWFQKAVINGRQVPAPYGSGQIRLARGLHTERGLWCVDCHGKEHVMGAHDAEPKGFALQQPRVSCSGCHGGWGPALTPDRLRHVGDARVLLSASGHEHSVPAFLPEHPAHDAAAHGRLRCDACHGLWSYQDYGLELVYQEGGDYSTWRYLTRQGDPFVEKALMQAIDRSADQNTSSPNQKDAFVPQSLDHLSGEQRNGLWLVGYRFRRWDAMPLGLDHQGRVAVMRPRHQYRVSAVDHRGVCVLDGAIPQRGDGSGRGWAFMPQALHSIAEKGRPCGACHGNAQAAGLGSDLAALDPTLQESSETMRVRDLALTTPQPPAVASMRLFSIPEAMALLEPSAKARQRIFEKRRGWLQLSPTAQTSETAEQGS